MADFDRRRFVLVRSTLAGQAVKVGTGYFITADLVLTASHVVPTSGLTALDVRTGGDDGTWRKVQPEAVWRDTSLDAVLIRVDVALDGIVDVDWADERFTTNVPWDSSAYPIAALTEYQGQPAWTTTGLGGTLYSEGGLGQGQTELDLGVADSSDPEGWAGVSGAPVFVGPRLAGFIKDVPPGFRGGRLRGVPATSLLQNPGFRIAISKPWLATQTLPKGPWVLLVLSEASDTDLGEWVDGTLENDREAIEAAIGGPIAPVSIKVSIIEAVQSPGHWLQFVKALCTAPIAVFDATNFEPAVMLALGVRAVVRRGVTVTSSARFPTPKELAVLPFNIKETKLVYHGNRYKSGDDKHPFKTIAAAIKKGWQELRAQPRYLDLPAYDGVRCAYPNSSADDIGAVERVLVLCPFDKKYDERNWRLLSNRVFLKYATRQPARMLDLDSPRLVGQALYEGIRWSRTCIVDWTRWRPNVFFELGARLACATTGPICLIDGADPDAGGTGQLRQKQRLLTLLRPTSYVATPDKELRLTHESNVELQAALVRHDANAAGKPPPVPNTALPHDATYLTCRDSFEWRQEGITVEPHEILRRSVQDSFGPDPQNQGRKPILFSTNTDYSVELEHSVRERWIAAWYYLYNRYRKEQWAVDLVLRAQVRKLANQVLQFAVRKEEREPHLQALRGDLEHVIDELDDLDELEKGRSA